MVITRYVKNGQSSTSQEVVGGVEEHDLLQEKLESQSGGGQNDYQQDCEETTEGDRIKTSSALRLVHKLHAQCVVLLCHQARNGK